MKCLAALAASLAIHVLLAVALVAYLEYAPASNVLATLDLSSVELSFAEKEEVDTVVAPLPPSPPPTKRPPPRAVEERPPEAVPEKALPPDPEAAKLREPQEAPPQVEPPPQVESPPVAQRQARIDAPPRPKRAIRPEYPRGARLRGEQGNVVLEIHVMASGAVDKVTVVESCGFAELDEAAVRAAREAKFTPARSGREAVASTARLTLSFKLK